MTKRGEKQGERAKTVKTEGLPLTPKNLLDVCSLTTTTTTAGKHGKHEYETSLSRQDRLDILNEWHHDQSPLMESLLFSSSDSKSGCFPLHWAAGTGFDEGVVFILDQYASAYDRRYSAQEHQNSATSTTNFQRLVNQWAVKPSTGRTPLHYAARNAHLSTFRLLVERYHADPNPKCHRGSVTPLQLAVWQNHLEIVQYLVHIQSTTNIVMETNAFQCGLNHWIGLIPKHRWRSSDGSGVLPLVRYLHQQGVSYTSSPNNQQNQGHTPLHKAAWGGNIALMEYFRDEHGVYDCFQDACGNYAADLAQMGGHTLAHEWLLIHGSISRRESCRVLQLLVTATDKEIQAQYKVLARRYHPDKLVSSSSSANKDDGGGDETFVKIKAAYEHLIHQGGIGNQKNPKYEALQMLAAASNSSSTKLKDPDKPVVEADVYDLFQARVLAIVSDYGDKGFPVSAIAKRWNQIWPDRPFPTADQYIIERSVIVQSNEKLAATQTDNTSTTTASSSSSSNLRTTIMVQKRVKLLKFLKWKCGGVLSFRKRNGVELAFQKASLIIEQVEKTTA